MPLAQQYFLSRTAMIDPKDGVSRLNFLEAFGLNRRIKGSGGAKAPSVPLLTTALFSNAASTAIRLVFCSHH